MNTSPIYNSIGNQYANNRVPDPRVAAHIWNAMGDAKTVCNVGAGTGSYEPQDRQVTAVEPSDLMIAQRSDATNVVQACAESLPFADQQFDVAMTVLSIHHWQDYQQGLREMKRVSSRQIIFTFDPTETDSLWLIRDYLPEVIEFDSGRAPSIDSIVETLGTAKVEPVLIPWDCTDGFQAAYWRRPGEYLKPEIRLSISTLAQLPADIVERAVKQLAADLKSGQWHSRNRGLMELTEKDFGYRLIVASS